MDNNFGADASILSGKLQEIDATVRDAIAVCGTDVIAILALLRKLEALHREIRDTVFQENLPQNRQHLYALLREIEAEGGWPYIERMRLKSLLVYLEQQEGNGE